MVDLDQGFHRLGEHAHSAGANAPDHQSHLTKERIFSMSQHNSRMIAVVMAIAISLGASLPAFSQDGQTPAPQTPAPQNAPSMSGMPQGGMMGHGGQGGMMGSGNQNGGQQGGMGNMMGMMNGMNMMTMMNMMMGMMTMMSQMNEMMMNQMRAQQGAGMMQGGMPHHHDAPPKSDQTPEKN